MVNFKYSNVEHLLYYPYINFPKSDWASRLLLYYDTIGTIVPQEYFYSPETNYEPFMLELVKNELVIPINPMNVLNNPWEIRTPILEYFESHEFKEKVRRQNIYRNREIHRKDMYNSKIHSDKFDEMIFYELERMGLALRGEGRWFYVPRFICNILMAFLTTIISQKTKMQPITDKIIRLNVQPGLEFNNNLNQERKKEIILKNLIPFPQNINLARLRKFKDNNIELLKAFKNKVELIVLDEHYIEGTRLFDEKLSELLIQKHELSIKMNENHLGNIFFGTICGVLGGIISFATASTTGAVILGLPGLFNAIHSALKVDNPNQIFDQTGMKYLALFEKQFR